MKNINYLPHNYGQYNQFRNLYLNDIYAYITCFPILERQAILNNLRASEWVAGYVPSVHSEMLSSGIAYAAIDLIANKITGDSLRLGGSEGVAKFLDNYGKELLTNTVNDIVFSTMQYGSTLACILFEDNDKTKPFIETSLLGTFRVKTTQSSRITQSTRYMSYSELSVTGKERLVVVEQRYFKNGKPKLQYTVAKLQMANGEDYFSKDNKYLEYERKDIPQEFKDKFSDYDFNKEYELPFEDNLGVFLFNNTFKNKRFRSCWFGESSIAEVNLHDHLYAYEHAFTAKENDKYLGRGRVIVPGQFKGNDNTTSLISKLQQQNKSSMGRPQATYRKPLDATFYDEVIGLENDKAKPESIQFNLRIEEWNAELDKQASIIASRLKISASDLDSCLNNGVQKTATEVSTETDLTASTITKKRNDFAPQLKELIRTISKCQNYSFEDIFIEWPLSGLSNMIIRNQVISTQHQSGLLSTETAIKKLNPNWSAEEIKEELERINLESSMQSEESKFNF